MEEEHYATQNLKGTHVTADMKESIISNPEDVEVNVNNGQYNEWDDDDNMSNPEGDMVLRLAKSLKDWLNKYIYL